MPLANADNGALGPQSSPDPYSSTGTFADAADSNPSIATQKGAPYQLPTSQLARPFPVIGPLLGFSQGKLQALATLHTVRNTIIAGRPVTQSEFEAQAIHDARLLSTSSYGAPAGIAVAIWRERKTAATFKFPFWQVDYKPDGTGKFNPDMFGPLRGAMARAAWHSLRKVAYGAAGGAFGTLIFATYAAQVAGVSSVRDPRLREVFKPMRQMSDADRQQLRKKLNDVVHDQEFMKSLFTGGPSPEGTPSMPSRWLRQSDPKNDAENGAETGFASRDLPIQEQYQSRDPERHSPQQSMNRLGEVDGRRRKEESSRRQESSGFFDVDDASPTAGNEPLDQATTAWDNLRRQALPQNQRQTGQKSDHGGRQADAWASRRSMPSSAALPSSQDQGNSLSFSSADEERQLAKSEAQKDFDARVDRERRGEDFNSNDRRW